ncbi:MAG: CxxxxCH/CxxCH domain-containing protein, partial [Desulfuromonadaceae bacterium]
GKMRNGDTSGSYRKPSWNMELTTNTPDATTCGRCHGMPPAAGTTASVHAPYTLVSDCTTCHTTVVDATGKIRNKKLHMDGKLQAPGAPCNSCHSAKSNDAYFAGASAHKFHIYTSMKWADYQDATETELYKRSSQAPVADTYKFKCGVCHDSTGGRGSHMAGNVSTNQTAEVHFGYYTTAGKTGVYVADTAVLAGTDTKGSRTWTAGSTTAGTSCMTTYCHSNGQDGANFVSGLPVSWATVNRTATPARCSLCHGGARGTANPMNTGKHNRHMNNWTTQGASLQKCTACHAGTVSNNTVVLPASVRHVNKQKNYSGVYAGDNYDPTTKTCTVFYCHSDSKGRFVNPGSWTAGQGPKNCDGCHGRSADGLQSSTNGKGYPNYTSTGIGTLRANSHPKHVAQLGINDTRGCATCHRSTIDRNNANRQHPLSSNHLDGNKSMDIKADWTAGVSFTYNTGTKTCSSASCHKSGKIFVQQFANVQWGDTGNCRMCHGGRASAYGGYSASRSGFNLSTTHKQHLKYPATNINCNICHYKTAKDAASFHILSGALKHNNNKREVRFAPSLAYGGYTAFKSWSSAEVPPATNTKVCANTACHGGVTRNSWQKTMYNNDNTCVHCHGVAGTSNTLPNTKENRKNFAPGWKGTGISTDGISSTMNIRVGSHFKHLSSAYMKTRNCNECHRVPDEPFTGTHMATPRYNSQTLNFDQASSAKWSGVTLANVVYTFNGYTAGTAIKAATCSSIYCHGNRLKNSDPGGVNTLRKPYWNYSAMVNYSNPGVACGRCHGNPPASVTASHNGKAATISCVQCHAAVVDATGKIVNKALHINGTIQVAAGDCMNCHNARIGTVVPRAAVVGQTLGTEGDDFVRKSRHVSQSGSTTPIVTNYDCILCHAEGDITSSGTTYKTASANHGGDSGTTTVDLRNVDTAGGNGIAVAWPGKRLAGFTATSTQRDGMDNFCLGCHDSNGASAIAVNNTNNGMLIDSQTTVTRSGASVAASLRPFNTNDNLTNGWDSVSLATFRQTTYGRVLNVRDQFNTINATGTAGYASHHNLNQYAKRYSAANTTYWPATLWTPSATTKDGAALGENVGLHCSDCHLNEANAHGSTNTPYMLQTINGTDATWTDGQNLGTGTIVCFRCHNVQSYTAGGTNNISRMPHDNGDSGNFGDTHTPFPIVCLNCHGGYSKTASKGLGAIHGTNDTWGQGTDPDGAGGTQVKRYRFLNGGSGRYFYPMTNLGTVNWETNTQYACYTIAAADTWGDCVKHTTGYASSGKAASSTRNRLLNY